MKTRVEPFNELLIGNMLNRTFAVDLNANFAKMDTVVRAFREIERLTTTADRVSRQAQEQINSLILNQSTSNMETVNARTDRDAVTHDTLRERLESDSAEVDALENDLREDNGYFSSVWRSPAVGSTRLGENGVPDYDSDDPDTRLLDPNEQLGALLDPLVDGSYAQRQVISKDESGEYDMVKYTFTPAYYEKTIIITSCLHGNEYTGFYSLAQFLDQLVNHHQEHKQLSYIRKNVRVIAVPIVNPWGFAHENRQNANQVDLNRNFDFNWQDYSSDTYGDTFYKGDSPHSEQEVKTMINLFTEYRDAVSLLDFHTIISESAEYIFFYPRFSKQNNNAMAKMIEQLWQPNELISWGSSSLPALTNYAAHNFDFNAFLPELHDGMVGDERGADEMTRALRWFGNCIIAASKMYGKRQVEVLDDIYAKAFDFDARRGGKVADSSYNNNEYVGFLLSRQDFRVATNGIVELSGHITFEIDEDATVGICPLLYQNYGGYFSMGESEERRNFEIRKEYKAGQHTLPLNAITRAQLTSITADGNNRDDEVVSYLDTWKTNGTLTILEYKPIIKFTPASSANAIEMHESTSAGNDGYDTFKRRYPDITEQEEMYD